MLVIVGFIIVIGSVLGGFTMAGGQIGTLIHPSEIVTIGGGDGWYGRRLFAKGFEGSGEVILASLEETRSVKRPIASC